MTTSDLCQSLRLATHQLAVFFVYKRFAHQDTQRNTSRFLSIDTLTFSRPTKSFTNDKELPGSWNEKGSAACTCFLIILALSIGGTEGEALIRGRFFDKRLERNTGEKGGEV